MTTLIHHIGLLAGVQDPLKPLRGEALKQLPVLENAWLLVEDGVIAGYGSMNDGSLPTVNHQFDAGGRMILPAWVDSHTHLVFAATREDEFVDKINGLGYAEIAAKGEVS